MKFTDEMLMAYADGEVDTATRTAIEAAAATDPRMAEVIARHRQLRTLLRREFAPILDEPVPSRLLEAAECGEAAPRSAEVRELQPGAAATVAPARRGLWPAWVAMAATFVLGAFVGGALRDAPSGPFEARNDRLVAAGELAKTLSTVLAREARPGSAIRPGLSYRTVEGELCRTFAISHSAGLACREGEHWRVDLLEPLPAVEVRTDHYRMAGVELPPALRDALEARIDGDPLDAAGEAAARDRGWR